MVGHTGKLDAAVRAVEILDGCLARIVTAVREAGGMLIVTADHGNAEQMWDPVNEPHTAHTSQSCSRHPRRTPQGYAPARRRVAPRRGADDAGNTGSGEAERNDGDGFESLVRKSEEVKANKTAVRTAVLSVFVFRSSYPLHCLFDFFLLGSRRPRCAATAGTGGRWRSCPVARRDPTTLAGVATFAMAPPFVVRPVHESDDGFESDAHFETGRARFFAARFHLRIIGDCSGNGIGELASQPVDDVIHCLILPFGSSAPTNCALGHSHRNRVPAYTIGRQESVHRTSHFLEIGLGKQR